MRLLTGSAADFLDDYFESDILKGYLASSEHHRDEGRAVLAGLRARAAVPPARRARRRVRRLGLPQAAATAGSPRSSLARRRRSAPRSSSSRRSTTSSPTGGRATGVALADGGEYHAPIVVSALDPRRTFLELVDPRELPTDLVEAIRRFRFQGTSAKVNFALDGIPRYPALGDRTDQYRGFTNIGPSMEYLEHAFDDAKYGWYQQRPYLDCAIQSTVDPDMAPPGKAVMSCFVQYAPYKLRESDWDTERERLGDTVQATLESFFPGFGELVLQREVRTPLDIERTVGLSEGNIFAGEFLAPQMYFFRPGAGLVAVPDPDRRLLPVRLGHAPGRLRHGRAGQARRRPDAQGPGPERGGIGRQVGRVRAAVGLGHSRPWTSR